MGEIMNSQRGVKSGVPERVSISCPTCGTRHDYRKKKNGNQSCVTVGEQTVQNNYVTQKCQICKKKVCMTTIEFPKSIREVSVKNILASITLKPA